MNSARKVESWSVMGTGWEWCDTIREYGRGGSPILGQGVGNEVRGKRCGSEVFTGGTVVGAVDK